MLTTKVGQTPGLFTADDVSFDREHIFKAGKKKKKGKHGTVTRVHDSNSTLVINPTRPAAQRTNGTRKTYVPLHVSPNCVGDTQSRSSGVCVR